MNRRATQDPFVHRTLLLALLCFGAASAHAQLPPPEKPFPLWAAGAPGALGSAPEDQPKLTPFPAPKKPGPGLQKATHTAVLILPGGAYKMIAGDYEGADEARWLNDLGVTAFVLQYRLGPCYHFPIQLDDASRAMRWIRQHAADYDVDPHRIGVWGFSAGGHLASTLGTHYDKGNPDATDPSDRPTDRPDFMILAYPVIDPLGPAAQESFRFLVGDHPGAALMQSLSTDLQVTNDTPMTFLVAAGGDKAVLPDNSVNFYLALRRAGVPAELHIYQNGGHGFGMAEHDPVLSTWTLHLTDWLRVNGLLDTK